MREKLNADGHDESQYLPKKWFNAKTGKEESYPIVNSFRWAKGDIRRNADDKLEAATWMPKRLNATFDEHGRVLLTGDEVNICERIERAARSAFAAIGISDLRSFSVGATDLGALAEYDPFKALIVGLLPYQSTMCLWVVCDERNRGNVGLAGKLIGSIRNSLDLANKVLTEASEAAKKKLEQSGGPDNMRLVALGDLRLEEPRPA